VFNVELRPEESAAEQAPSRVAEGDQQAADRRMSGLFQSFAAGNEASGERHR
jgi:hypothetical protein